MIASELQTQRDRQLDIAFNLTILLTIGRDGFGAAIRYYLVTSQIESLWYAVDVFYLVVVGWALLTRGLTHRAVVLALTLLAIIAVSFVQGLILHGSVLAAAAGSKVLLCAPAIISVSRPNPRVWGTAFFALGAAICLGVVADAQMQFPWTKQVARINGVDRAYAMSWYYTGGVRRLAGFSAASYSAATDIAMCAFMWLISAARPFLVNGVALAASVYTIYLTTTRSSALALALGALPLLFIIPRRRAVLERFGALASGAVCLFSLSLPLTIFALSISSNSTATQSFLASTLQRLYVVWPAALNHATGTISTLLFGAGAGSIGEGPKYYNPLLFAYSFSDNISIYLISQFGIGVIGLFVSVFFWLVRGKTSWSWVACGCFTLGVFMNVVESASFVVMVAAIAQAVMSRRSLAPAPTQSHPVTAPQVA